MLPRPHYLKDTKPPDMQVVEPTTCRSSRSRLSS